MNKFDRIVTILTLLQSKKIIKAQYIADRFEVSLRTVYRDIRTLESAGIPIISEAGVGYSIMPGYHLPPVMFSSDEASALVTAEKLFEKMVDPVTHKNFNSALTKIKSVLRSTEKETVENLENHIAVYRSPWSSNAQDFPELQKILNAIDQKNILKIHYEAAYAEKSTQRQIEPVGVYFTTENWYLIAYCRLRADYRNFRLDRIKQLQVEDHKFEAVHPQLQTYLDQLAKEQELETVVLTFDKVMAKYTQTQKFMLGFTQERDLGDRVEMTFLVHSFEQIAHWLITYTKYVEVISPLVLKNRVKELACDLYNHHVKN
jgi:predicted DNA-binding transcriptional regulator YafY